MTPEGGTPTLAEVTATLARRWATLRLAAVQSYGRILADYGSGRSSSAAAAGALLKLAAEEAVRYPADAVSLATDYASAVAGRAGSATTSPANFGRQASPIQDIEISGPLGGVAATEFYLSNPHQSDAQLTFLASRFMGSSGESPATASFDPASFTLPAGAEQAVRVSVALKTKAFKAGESYTANVAISGFDEMVLRIRLTVLDAA